MARGRGQRVKDSFLCRLLTSISGILHPAFPVKMYAGYQT